MTLPALPSQGSTNWYEWAQGLDATVRAPGSSPPAPGVANPADYGLRAWSMDPAFAAAAVPLTAAGVARGVRVQDQAGGVRSAVAMQCTTAGVGLVNTYVAVYDSLGNRLAVSGDVSTAGSISERMNAAGAKRIPMTAAYTVPTDGVIVITLHAGTATTLPQISGANVGSTLNFNFPGTGTSNARSFTAGTGLTTAPTTIDLTTVTPSNNLPWMASAA